MKKLLTFLFIGICGAFVFAETGYGGIQWGMTINQIPHLVYTVDDTHYFTKKILGKTRNVFLEEWSDGILSIYYVLPITKTQELIKKLPAPSEERYALKNQKLYEDYEKECKETIKNIEIQDQNRDALLDREYAFEGLRIAQLCEYVDNEPESSFNANKNKKNCTLLIYDYNDDTRLYVIENEITQQTYVVYCYHEQDY